MKSLKLMMILLMTATFITSCGSKKGSSKAGTEDSASKSDKKDGMKP